ncbi:hypothetical protein A2U01_0059820, partial [Trifolium medium]|nr:hypothetical protein [Trifolium medium]
IAPPMRADVSATALYDALLDLPGQPSVVSPF